MQRTLEQYNEIMERYRNGAFGTGYLSLHEILTKAGEPDLLDRMSQEEIEELTKRSAGLTRYMFNMIKERKNESIRN